MSDPIDKAIAATEPPAEQLVTMVAIPLTLPTGRPIELHAPVDMTWLEREALASWLLVDLPRLLEQRRSPIIVPRGRD